MELKVYEYKRDCHFLLEKIWGADKKGRSQAYMWLKNEMGREIHFADINEIAQLIEIYNRLLNYSILVENRRLVEQVAPAWDMWIDNKFGGAGGKKRGRRFNRKRSRQINGEDYQ